MAKRLYRATCHCGQVAIEADLDLRAGTGRCNCSICGKSRYWGAIVAPDDVAAIEGENHLAEYRFGSQTMQILFCVRCGIRVFGKGYLDLLGGDFYSINLACLDNASDEELAAAKVRYSNGRDDDWMNEPLVTAHL
ncbi:hypothetical protein ACVWZA_002180 [Sphingomonas sp. UYAg733]